MTSTRNPHRKVGVFCLVGIGYTGAGILSGKKVYDTYYDKGKSRQNLNLSTILKEI